MSQAARAGGRPNRQTSGTGPGHDTDESDSDSSSSWSEYELSDDCEQVRPQTVPLGLNRDYAPRWGKVDAFREFFQNWKDALVTSFDLDPRSFAPQRQASGNKNEIVFTLHAQDTNQLLGYIRYKRRQGTLELTNFDASLNMRDLTLGGGSKSKDPRSAGVHGEGFKIAALAMIRMGHSVRISASSHYWSFGLRGTHADRLYCRLLAPKPHILRRSKQQAAHDSPRSKLLSRMWQDVTVMITKGRDGRKIEEAEVEKWFKVSIDLVSPRAGSIIRARQGDLILDRDFAGQVFIKGLRADGHGPDGRAYVYGYKLVDGHINRDRERLMDKRGEATMVARMWQQAIELEPDGALQKYIRLFHENENSPDIALADWAVPTNMARSIWRGLRASQPDAFFYSEASPLPPSQVAIIVTNIKKTPERLPKALWQVLRKHTWVNTPEEERRHLFRSCARIETPNDTFGASVMRLLKSAMLLDVRLKDITFQVVEGGETGLDLLYINKKKLILLHSKWLNFDEAHEGVVCDLSESSLSRESDTEGFCCDHVVEDLVELVIEEVKGFDPAESRKILRLARQRIRQTPRKVQFFPTLNAGELRVRWVGNESGIIAKDHSSNIFFEVTLHKVSCCKQVMEQLLHRDGSDGDGHINPACDCDRQTVCLSSCKAVFGGLDAHEEYFPMVARTGDKTFFACPPRAQAALRGNSMMAFPNTPQSSSLSSAITLSSVDFMALEGEYNHEDDDGDGMAYGQRANNTGSSASADSNNNPVSSGNQGARSQVDGGGWEELRQDNEAWHEWYTTELPKTEAELFYNPPNRSNCNSQDIYADSSIFCERLGCVFERDSYVRFRENFTNNEPEYVALIHEIHSGTDGCATESPHFTATVWTYLDRDPLFKDLGTSAGINAPPQGPRELLLHFSSLENMGCQSDARLISIDEIIEAEILPGDFEVIYCATFPVDAAAFCRFARNYDNDAITIVPLALAPRLLPRQNRERPKGFINPSSAFVIDSTPNVLGPLEGFTDLECEPWLGLGFDPERDLSWRVRYPECKIFDGKPTDVLDDFASRRLFPPELPPAGHPVIVLASGENTNFRRSPANKKLPSLDTFLAPLLAMKGIINSSFNPDFGVLQMPPSLLAPSAMPELSTTIFSVLERKYTVRINIVNLRDFGIMQDRTVVVVLASRFPGLVSAPLQPCIGSTLWSPEVVGDNISELRFENPRMGDGRHAGFVSSLVRGEGSELGLSSRYVYNHSTGERSVIGPDPVSLPSCVSMNDSTFTLSWNGQQPPYHRDRGDYLTPREIARLLHFNDDFVLYGYLRAQYREILSAQPPALSQAIAENILWVANLSRRIEIPVVRHDGGVRPLKRARVDDYDDNEAD